MTPDDIGVGRDNTPPNTGSALQTAQEMLALMLSGIPLGVIVTDETNHIEITNAAASRLLGWGAAEMSGRPFTDFLPAEARSEATARHGAQIKSGASDRQHGRILRRDGTLAEVEMTTKILRRPSDGRSYRMISLSSAEETAPATLGDTVRARFAGDKESATIVAGRVQLVDLSTIKEVMGGRWQTVAERIGQIAERIIRRRLALHDVVERVEDDGYLICFASLSEAEASFKARAISGEIHTAVLGELSHPALGRLSTHVASVEVTRGEAEKIDDLSRILMDRLKGSQAALEEQSRRSLRDAVLASAIEPTTICANDGRGLPIALARLPAAIELKLSAAQEILGSNTEIAIETDLILLAKGAELIAQRLSQGDAISILIVPLHFVCFASKKSTARVLELCRSLSEGVRRRLVFELREVPSTVSQARLDEITAALRQFSRGLSFALTSLDPGQLQLVRQKVQFVSFDHSVLERGSVITLDGASKLARIAHALGARVLLCNVPTTARLTPYKTAGIDLVTLLGLGPKQ